MTKIRKWFAIGIIVLIIVDMLASLFVFPHLSGQWQARVSYVTVLTIFVLGMVLTLSVLWEVIQYVFSNVPKRR